MSHRELRAFAEIMRVLGYPRLLSLDNFRSPNFALVADLLYWLVQRYEPGVKVPDDIDTEAQRVRFLAAAAAVMSSKARIQCVLRWESSARVGRARWCAIAWRLLQRRRSLCALTSSNSPRPPMSPFLPALP